ncbi:hypothetical protein [Oribacterium sp. WCC10]|uniref:hypothetical protein n=1 Tax=Oribacterium sp. WCC10 TaxID=1855343 RepID=UPI0008F30BFE|nr:hypothetical protein [Oribacterium sp. WCC10]SFG39893.1 hypothetical protein SAMN05216356_107104 [Oribacterium sp. WCC10]
MNPEILKPEALTREDRHRLTGVLRTWSVAFCFFFVIIFCSAFTSRGDTIDISVTYGYQNIAKAGRFLPLSIYIDNTGEQTFSGYIHVYMVEAENSVYEYRYKKTVEGESDDTLSVTVSLSSGVNQILVTAEDINGNIMGSRRVGLDVAGSDAELIIGTISQNPEALSYLGGVGINNGILRTRTVGLNLEKLPQDKKELDQLDVLLISGYTAELMKESEANTILEWVRNGGVLVMGTGARGEQALAPYFNKYLKNPLSPTEMKVQMVEDNTGSQNGTLKLTTSIITLNGGRAVMFSDNMPILSTVTEGVGVIAVCGYDFCDIQRFATDQYFYVDQLFTAILGQSRLDKLSTAASERSLKLYWDIKSLMNMSDITKIPEPMFYVVILMAYVLLIGPGIYFYLRTHEMIRIYRSSVLVITILATLLIWVMGVGTRLTGPFLTYARLKEVSEHSVNETDYINLRSPYYKPYSLDVKSEYYVYPVLKGSDYNGDIQDIAMNENAGHTTISNNRDKTEITITNTAPFTARYFELNTKTPNTGGSFTSDMVYFGGKVEGTLKNDSKYSLSDAAILIYGKVILIGKLDAGESVELSGKEMINVPVGDFQRIADTVANGADKGFLKYYISNNMTGYYSDAKLVGFVREDTGDDSLEFTSETNYESYGTTMVVSSLPLNTRVGDEYSYSALSTDPEVDSGYYNVSDNTISGIVPTVLSYHLGEGSNIKSISIESLGTEFSEDREIIGNIKPFKGSLSFYNNQTGGFDAMDIGNGVLNRTDLTPYLNMDNVLVIKYTPSEQNAGIDERSYLPMITVTVKENVAVIDQILESDMNGESDDSETQETEAGPSPVGTEGTVVVSETAPGVTETAETEGAGETIAAETAAG